MWTPVLVLGLIAATDPVRIGLVLLVISRQRPMINLLMYWLGTLLISIATVLIVLLGMRDFFPTLIQKLAGIAASPFAQYAQIAVGLLMIAIATSIGIGVSMRSQVPAQGPADDAATTAVLQRRTANPMSRLLSITQRTFKDGSSWVSFVIGLASAPPPVESLAAYAIIVTSGATLATQLCAGMTFVVAMLIGFEIALICYIVAPSKTHAIILRLHEWLHTHRPQIFAFLIATVGIILVIAGITRS